MIDVHVHLRDGAQSEKETLLHGMMTAARLGVTALFDMPNTVPPLTSEGAVTERLEAGRTAVQQVAQVTGTSLFYGVYGGVTADSRQLEAIVSLYRSLSPAMVGLKLFAGHSTGNMGLTLYEEQLRVYQLLAQFGYTGVLAVHCEKESLMRTQLWDPAKPESHGHVRPAEAEIASVADQIKAVRETGFSGTLHICHISTAGAIDLVDRARTHGVQITCGATSHHALLNDSVAGTPGHLCKMNPPLRDESDRAAVFSALLDGRVDWIESDHAPHTLADKAAGASGIPGFAGTALLIRSLRRAGLPEAHLRRLCGERALQVFAMDLPVSVPSDAHLGAVLPELRDAYPWDPFSSVQ
jgi:dihydroorotase